MSEVNEQVKEYLEERSNVDINLLDEVRKIFIEAGMVNKIPLFNKHHFIIEAENKLPNVQRYFLNRYFNIQLSFVSNSFLARYNLISDGEFSYWLELFKENVLPVLLENDLPVSN